MDRGSGIEDLEVRFSQTFLSISIHRYPYKWNRNRFRKIVKIERRSRVHTCDIIMAGKTLPGVSFFRLPLFSSASLIIMIIIIIIIIITIIIFFLNIKLYS